METKRYTTHSYFWGSIAALIIWVIVLIICKSSVASIIICSLAIVQISVMAIRCGLAWRAYVEISEEGVKMKGCAKRVSDGKKEIVDDIFIPWENIEKINVWDNTPLILKTGEKIKLTQPISIDGKTLRKAFELHKSKPQPKPKQTQEDSLTVVGIYGQDSDSTSPNE